MCPPRTGDTVKGGSRVLRGSRVLKGSRAPERLPFQLKNTDFGIFLPLKTPQCLFIFQYYFHDISCEI